MIIDSKMYYQPKGGKKGQFALRENTYRRMWYLIADYPYFKWITENRPADSVREETAAYQIDCSQEQEQLERYIEAIERAKQQIPEDYVEYIMSHIIEKKRYKDMDGVSEKTLKIWTQRFIWHVARNLGDA